MGKLVSVIMSTYNEEPEWIISSIDSILNQTYSNIEFIIILDNHNNLVLKEILEGYREADNRIKLIINKENLGLVGSLNVALNYCNGTYIARMDADDISERDRLRKQKEFLENNNLDFVFSGMTIINEKGNKVREWPKKKLDHLKVKKAMGIYNISTHPTWFVKKDVYMNLNGYRNIPHCEDYDFSLRALNYGYRIGKIGDNLLMYRIRGNSISRSNTLEQFLICRELAKIYKISRIEDILFVNKKILKISNLVKKSSDKRFIDAEIHYEESIKMYKKGRYFSAIFKLLNSIFTSKYILLKIFDLFKYKITM